MECYGKFYIHNYQLKSTSEFDEGITSKGTSIYEVIKIQQAIPLFLEDHLNRLFESADLSKLQINEGYCDFESLIDELIVKNNIQEGKIKLVIHFNEDNSTIEKDLLIYFTPHYFPGKKEYENG